MARVPGVGRAAATAIVRLAGFRRVEKGIAMLSTTRATRAGWLAFCAGLLASAGAFAQSTADLGGGTLKEMIATEFIIFLVFVPLFAFGALSEVMEEKALVRTFFMERLRFEVAR